MCLKKFRKNDMNKTIEDLHSSAVSDKKLPPIMYGLQGIIILADACTKRGCTILIDTKKALSLFGVNDPDEMVCDAPEDRL